MTEIYELQEVWVLSFVLLKIYSKTFWSISFAQGQIHNWFLTLWDALPALLVFFWSSIYHLLVSSHEPSSSSQFEMYMILIIENCSILRILVNITIMMAFRELDEVKLFTMLTFYPEMFFSRFRWLLRW
jgi:hypothetical protein